MNGLLYNQLIIPCTINEPLAKEWSMNHHGLLMVHERLVNGHNDHPTEVYPFCLPQLVPCWLTAAMWRWYHAWQVMLFHSSWFIWAPNVTPRMGGSHPKKDSSLHTSGRFLTNKCLATNAPQKDSGDFFLPRSQPSPRDGWIKATQELVPPQSSPRISGVPGGTELGPPLIIVDLVTTLLPRYELNLPQLEGLSQSDP